jgi:DNA polymerase-4
MPAGLGTRIVMHVDMDAFYASVELRRRPELRGKPVIVGGSPRGVVLSATYEARAKGVRSGISSAEARRLAPNAIFLAPDFDSYSAVSKAIVAVFRSVTAVVESASIDEAFLDLTGAVRMFGRPMEIGEYIRAVVSDEQQITCSVGIGPTKFVAKVSWPSCIHFRSRRCGESATPLHKSFIAWGSSPSASWLTLHEPLCAPHSVRMPVAC